MNSSSRKLVSLHLGWILVFSLLLSPIAISPAAAAGNQLTVSGNQAYTFAGINSIDTAGNAQIISASVEKVSGSGDMTNVTHDVFWTDPTAKEILNVQVVRTVGTDTYNLSKEGFDHQSTFKFTITVGNYTPRFLFGAGNVSDRDGWYAVKNSNGSATVTIFVHPIETDSFFHPENGTTPSDSWFNGTKQANNHTEAGVVMAIDSLAVFEQSRAENFTGTTIETDAQALATPVYIPPESGGPRVGYDVNAPHFALDGAVNQGFYEIFIPESLLTSWGDPDITNLTANFTAGSVSFTASDVVNASSPPRLGVYATVDFHYSSGTMKVGTQGGIDAGDEEDTPSDDGSDQTVSVDISGSTGGGAGSTATATATPAPTPTATPPPSPSSTPAPSPTPTAGPSPTASASPTAIASPTAAATASPTPVPSPTPATVGSPGQPGFGVVVTVLALVVLLAIVNRRER